MTNNLSSLVDFARLVLGFMFLVVAWWLVVAVFGQDAVGAACIALAAVLAYSLGVVPAVACNEFGRNRPDVLFAVPLAALVGAFIGRVSFHLFLQVFVNWFPAISQGAAMKAEATGSIVVWAVLSASILLVAMTRQAPKPMRIAAALVTAGLVVGLARWVMVLGI